MAASKRALTVKGQATRDRIVDAASDLMVERGVSVVTLDDVGQATSTSKSQMYHYFASKDELVDAVVIRVRDRVLSFQESLLLEVQSVDDLENWAEAIVRFQRQDGMWCGCPLGTLASELMSDIGVERVDIRYAYESWLVLLTTALTALQGAGQLRADAQPEVLAVATLASLQGGLLMAKSMQDESPLVVALAAALDHLRTFR
jgi:TetR/AcrR family transcriptional regulator, transcriptional repressor for nem operon